MAITGTHILLYVALPVRSYRKRAEKRFPQLKRDDGTEVPADNPTGTMRRFSDGLSKVLTAPKAKRRIRTRKQRKR